ncbi:hypothetical protein HPTD01_2908 [Halomonas sp. TD01]|nr:hypothetical protein HPTD01_2908 [Halomonas sp. TD01]
MVKNDVLRNMAKGQYTLLATLLKNATKKMYR